MDCFDVLLKITLSSYNSLCVYFRIQNELTKSDIAVIKTYVKILCSLHEIFRDSFFIRYNNSKQRKFTLSKLCIRTLVILNIYMYIYMYRRAHVMI